jgi:plasmid stabilization system protein ParE
MRFEVRLTPEAEADILRLFDFLAERDVQSAERARAAIEKALEFLQWFPQSCRKARGHAGPLALRELVIAFGKSGYVALFEVEREAVTILAVRHQREDEGE